MFLAEIDTANFHFTAIGASQQQAFEALERGWNVHRKEYGPSRVVTFAEILEEVGDVRFSEVRMGGCMRDGETLNTRTTD